MDDKKERSKKRQYLVVMLMAAVLVLYPFQTEIVPAWRVQFVDEAGAPWKEITVVECWRNPRSQYREYRHSLVTDNNGYISFPRQTTRSPLLVRLIGSAVNAVHVHGYHSTYVCLIPLGSFSSEGPTQFYLPVDTLPSKMTLRCLSQEPCK